MFINTTYNVVSKSSFYLLLIKQSHALNTA